jgi:hypothetical protein
MTVADWIALAAVIATVMVPTIGFVYGTLRNKIADSERATSAIGEKLDDARADLAAFKLQVAKEYASVDHLQDVERRILDGFKELKADLKAGLESLARQLAEHRAEEGRK